MRVMKVDYLTFEGEGVRDLKKRNLYSRISLTQPLKISRLGGHLL